jgi:tetraacyldisaccharide-1-P 4'-kinase
VAYPDHHDYTESEITTLLAAHPGIQFVCTAKDAVKLRELGDSVLSRFAVLRVVAKVVPHDAFFVQIERFIRSAG